MEPKIYMPAYIQEKTDLANTYAADGAYASAARVLEDLAEFVREHADRIAEQERPL